MFSNIPHRIWIKFWNYAGRSFILQNVEIITVLRFPKNALSLMLDCILKLIVLNEMNDLFIWKSCEMLQRQWNDLCSWPILTLTRFKLYATGAIELNNRQEPKSHASNNLRGGNSLDRFLVHGCMTITSIIRSSSILLKIYYHILLVPEQRFSHLSFFHYWYKIDRNL